MLKYYAEVLQKTFGSFKFRTSTKPIPPFKIFFLRKFNIPMNIINSNSESHRKILSCYKLIPCNKDFSHVTGSSFSYHYSLFFNLSSEKPKRPTITRHFRFRPHTDTSTRLPKTLNDSPRLNLDRNALLISMLDNTLYRLFLVHHQDHP